MLGAIAGDIIGSVYEHANVKRKDFALFTPASRATDDTVLTLALAESLLDGVPPEVTLRAWHARYPQAGYGRTFLGWVDGQPPPPPGGASNGGAMRVAALAWALGDLDGVLAAAERCTRITHAHDDGVRGAQAVAAAVFAARTGATKDAIRQLVESRFGYDLSQPLDTVRPGYAFDVSCAGTVPHALRAFLEGTDFEDTVRNAVSIGGDSDTLACMAGAVAEAFHGGVPAPIAAQVWARLDVAQAALARRFLARHGLSAGGPSASPAGPAAP